MERSTRFFGYVGPSLLHSAAAASVLTLACVCPSAFAQATIEGAQRVDPSQRPPPAAERFAPVLDVWWQDAVFYQVFVRSFADSTDGPLAGDGVGDIRGLIERLDYLNDGDPDTHDDLGITAIWLMPITASPSYHGYDTTDYKLINPDYGTNDDMLELIRECRERGIRVIIDLVLNHCSNRHPWFLDALHEDSEKRDWFIWVDEDPGFRGPWGQRVWHRADARGRDGVGIYYGIFSERMPDLNFRNPEVTEAAYDIATFWLADMGIDGFRLDAIRHLIENGRIQDNTPETHDWLRGFFEHCKSVRDDAFLVGEVWADSDDVSRYVGDQMDTAFEFTLGYRIVDAISQQNAGVLVDQLRRIISLYPHGMYATFLRNHDQPRTRSELGGCEASARLAATILLTLPGVPFIYYGEELGMEAVKSRGDTSLRTPMPWNDGELGGFSSAEPWQPFADGRSAANVLTQTGDPDSMLSLHRRLIRLRQTHSALRTGAMTIVPTSDRRVLAIRRDAAPGDETGADLLCLFNLAGVDVDEYRLENSRVPTGGRDLLHGVEVVADSMNDDAAGKPIRVLRPRRGYIIELSPE